MSLIKFTLISLNCFLAIIYIINYYYYLILIKLKYFLIKKYKHYYFNLVYKLNFK